MSVTNVYHAGAIFVHDLNLVSAVGFAGLTNENIELGNEIQTSRAFASVYERDGAITRRAPTIGVTTQQIGTALDLVGGSGRCIKSDVTHPGLDAYLLNSDECNQYDLTDSRRYRMEQGILIPESLTVEHQGVGSIGLQAIAVSKGGNEPLQEADAITMPTGAVDDERYGLYQQTVGGVLLTGSKSLGIEFGVTVTQEDADGAIYPEWVSVGSIVTRVTLGGINPKWLGSSVIPVGGRKMLHTDTTLRLARYSNAEADSYMDLTGNHHIAITVAGLGYITTAANASGGAEAATSSLVLVALHDGTNTPLQIDTTAALA